LRLVLSIEKLSNYFIDKKRVIGLGLWGICFGIEVEKIQVGSLYVYKDESSRELCLKCSCPGSIKTLGTTGECKEEALASLLQIAPALYGEIFGLAKSGLLAVVEKYDCGATTIFARAIIEDDQVFGEVMGELIRKGFVREEESDGDSVYFPTESYLGGCGVLGY
jgi:hypothetical protein